MGEGLKHIFLGNQRIGEYNENNVLTLILSDHLGSSSVLLTSNGNISALYDYYPYGDARIVNEIASNSNYRYTSKELDKETDLHYYEQRYYDQKIGKFNRVDPLFFKIASAQELEQEMNKKQEDYLANPQAFNSYAYAGNNPILYIDPNGEWFKEFFTGQQSWSDFSVEVGQVAQALYDSSSLAKTVMDHPVASGVVIGVASGGAAAVATLATGGSITCGILCGGAAAEVSGTVAATQWDKIVQQTTKLLNPGIKITQNALTKISKVHQGTYNGVKSVFNEGENITELIQKTTQHNMIPQLGDKFARIVDVGRNIGIDRLTGQQTSNITVITNKANELITAFPGIPGYLSH